MNTKTLSVHDLRVHAWWSDTLVYSDYFFDVTTLLEFDSIDSDPNTLFQELVMIRHSFEEADYPPCATTARYHLLNSMSQVMEGFKAFLVGNIEVARNLMANAQYELFRLEDEMNRLGTSVLFLEKHLQ